MIGLFRHHLVQICVQTEFNIVLQDVHGVDFRVEVVRILQKKKNNVNIDRDELNEGGIKG